MHRAANLNSRTNAEIIHAEMRAKSGMIRNRFFVLLESEANVSKTGVKTLIVSLIRGHDSF